MHTTSFELYFAFYYFFRIFLCCVYTHTLLDIGGGLSFVQVVLWSQDF